MTETIVGVTHQIDTELVEKQRQLDVANSTIEKLRADVTRLNEFMNKYANDSDWCSDYDETLDEWNRQLTAFQLTTRLKKYTVTVEVKLTYENSVEVNARNESHARDLVGDMDTYTVIDGLGINDYEDSDWHCESAREGSL